MCKRIAAIVLLLALLPALACAPVRTEAPSRTAALSDAPAAEPESTETEGWGDPDSGDEPYAPLPALEIESFSYRYGETLLLLFRDGDGTACLFAEKDGEAVQGTADASVLDALSDVLLREHVRDWDGFSGKGTKQAFRLSVCFGDATEINASGSAADAPEGYAAVHEALCEILEPLLDE